MKNQATFIRSGLICLTLSLVPAGSLNAQVQVAPETTANPTAKTGTVNTANPGVPPMSAADAVSQAELLKSYLHVREQLHDAELAIANNRLEAEAAARAQAAAIAEKLDSIKSTIAAERERQAAEAQRAAAEQERQRIASQEANHIILWIAASFGGVGLLAMLATAVLQWRGIKRMAEVTAQHPQLPAVAPQNWLTTGNNGAAGGVVALSNQRLMSVIDRMERRILELETTTAQPPVSTLPTEPVIETTPPRSTPAALDQAAHIAALLGKGRSLLNANKAREALACYDEILAIEANHPEALVKKGSALERLNQDLQAIECYDRAIQADRNLALAYLSKGGVFNRLQRFDEAVECYEKALQVEKQTKPPGVVRVSVSGEWPTSGSSVPA